MKTYGRLRLVKKLFGCLWITFYKKAGKIKKYMKKTKKEKEYPDWMMKPCCKCGARFGEDGRAFEFEKEKEPICFICRIDEIPEDRLRDWVKLLAKR